MMDCAINEWHCNQRHCLQIAAGLYVRRRVFNYRMNDVGDQNHRAGQQYHYESHEQAYKNDGLRHQ